MVSILGHHVNKPVLVSIPPLFGNGELHRCQLVGIEPAGLWLESEGLSRIAFPDADPRPATVFVPFTQVAYLIGAPAVPPPARRRAESSRRGRKQPRARPGEGAAS